MGSMADHFGGHSVLFSWGPAGALALAPHVDVLVVVDVLSFSTSVEVAVSRGAVVFPYPARDETSASFAQAQGAILASAWRQGSAQSPYSLSPSSLLEIRPGTRLVLPSPNGATIAAAAARAGIQVICGCLRNAEAVAATSAQRGRAGVIAAGERWPDGSLRPALEDLLGAGAILSHLPESSLSPDARAAVAAYRAAHIEEDIAASPSGRELFEAGFAEDVAIAIQEDMGETVPVLRDGFQGLSSNGDSSDRPEAMK
jgi:2-phosphosulfolactate phosphatase